LSGLFCEEVFVIGTLLITWREGIEAALIVGILLTYLVKLGQRKSFRYVYWGTFWAVLACLVFAYLSNRISFLFVGIGEDLFDASILFVAVVVMTHMIFWMHRHARELKGSLQRKADAALAKQQLWGLGVIAFIGVFREGVETVLFLWGLALQQAAGTSSLLPFLGGLLGLSLAVATAWLFFKGFGHLDLRPFFKVTGILLLILAAGMLATGIRKLLGSDIFAAFPWASFPIWDTSRILDERNFIGSLAAGLFGYASHPSLLEVLAYVAYLSTVLLWLRWLQRPRPAVSHAGGFSPSPHKHVDTRR
jgi:high-affinity iron transporter